MKRCYIDESYGLHLIYAQGSSLHKIPFKQSDADNVSPYKNRIVFIPGILLYLCDHMHFELLFAMSDAHLN